MKYFERFINESEIKECDYGIEVINKKGQRYVINFDYQERLIIQCPNEYILIQPKCDNQITITTNER